MTDIESKSATEDAEALKLRNLCHLVLHNADAEHDKIISSTRDEIQSWIHTRNSETDSQAAEILADAKRRAAEISARQISNAKIDSERERLKLLASCVQKATVIFREKLEALSQRDEYPEILAGLAIEAVSAIPHVDLCLALSERDAKFGEKVVEYVKKIMPSVKLKFDVTPANISGGVRISTHDGRWDIVSDWKAKSDELSDTIASRVLEAL